MHKTKQIHGKAKAMANTLMTMGSELLREEARLHGGKQSTPRGKMFGHSRTLGQCHPHYTLFPPIGEENRLGTSVKPPKGIGLHQSKELVEEEMTRENHFVLEKLCQGNSM